ncbi:FAD-binding protein [Actinomadura darangshiensis]|uniref:FAD-binding protein n=1 Tax=Actinomadura darangshiensis TaxID=705336 RepID=A0A4R5ASJ7_9ACTN|nr:FAD-dependent oxidoreductase [Actinomadura darangshiensis]TDD74789.1 FAD-binding protein [Actinomadura darangshiensis]
MTPFPSLAAPLKLGQVTLANRIVSAPMERNYCTPDGVLTDAYIGYLEERAAGGAALVFSEAAYVRADGKGRVRQMGLTEDRHIPGMAALAETIHRHGSRAGVELNHGGRTVQSKVSGTPPVAPSAVPCLPAGGDMPTVLGSQDVHDLVDAYGAAARRCREAGVDVLSIHAAHGYLVHQFLSPLTNLRTDEFADPTRFLDLVVQAVRQAAPDLCVGIRISAFEGVPDGLDAARTLQLIGSARLDLLDFIDVSAGNYEAAEWMVQPGEQPPGVLAPSAEPYRSFGLPVGVAGRIAVPRTAEAVIAGGQADFVSMARALHADPRWPNRVLAGEPFRPCIACNLCIDRLHSGAPVPCTVNPEAGTPSTRRAAASHAPPPGRSLVIVGAGPAGLEMARRVAGRGVRVHILEQEDRAGGELALAARLHCFPRYQAILDWYTDEMDRLGVVLHTGTRADHDVVTALRPSALVIATGGRVHAADVEGTDLPHVIEVREWLRRGDAPPERCTVWGFDRAAMAVADHLAVHGCEVQIVGAGTTLAPEAGPRARNPSAARLRGNPKVSIHLGYRVRAIRNDHLVVDGPDGRTTIPTRGPVIASHGVKPAAPGIGPVERLGIPVHLTGGAAGYGSSMHDALQHAVSTAADLLQTPR